MIGNSILVRLPNVLANGEKLLVFDHELAFSFADLLPFAINQTPWVFGPLEREMYLRHYFFNLLRGENNKFSEHVKLISCFDNSFWHKAEQLIPDEWKTAELPLIQQHINAIVENQTAFAEQLTLILAA